MNRYVILIISFIMILGLTACSGSSVGTELPEGSSGQGSVTVTTVEEKTTEAFSPKNTTEAVETSDIKKNDTSEKTANTEETYDISTTAPQPVTSSETAEGEAVSDGAKAYFIPFDGNINEYCGKEVSFVCFYFIRRYPLILTDDEMLFSVLYGFSDGSCNAEIFTNNDYFTPFSDTNKFAFDEINEPISELSEEIEGLDSDTINNINVLIQQLDFESGYTDHFPDSRNPNIAHPAVDPDYDAVDFYAADEYGNLHRILYDYVFPEQYGESRFISTQIELNDEDAEMVARIIKDSDVFIYWLENYAWKIGE